MRKILEIIIPCIVLIFACHSPKTETKTQKAEKLKTTTIDIQRDWGEIQEDGKLKALVAYSGTSYFLYRGQPMGYEYDLLVRLADYLGLELEIHVSKNIDSLLSELKKGKVDIVAHGLAITSARKKNVTFTNYLYLTQQVLVQKKPENWRSMKWTALQRHLIHDPIELIDDTVSVRKNSSYFQRIKNLSKEIGDTIFIDTLDGNLSTDEIIEMVVEGKIKYTIADKNLASINASYYPILNIEVPVSFSQRIAWAIRPSSPELLEKINEWIKKERAGVDYYVIYNKYFKNKQSFRRRVKSEFYSLSKTTNISSPNLGVIVRKE